MPDINKWGKTLHTNLMHETEYIHESCFGSLYFEANLNFHLIIKKTCIPYVNCGELD